MQQFVEDVPVAKGEAVINAGDEMNFAFLIIKGTFSINLGSDESGGSKDFKLKSAGTGKWIGQMFFLEPDKSSVTVTAAEDGVISLIDNKERTATCRARDKVKVAELSRDTFESLREQSSDIACMPARTGGLRNHLKASKLHH